MKTYTLEELLNAHNHHSLNGVDDQTLAAISAAYWAGQSQARAEERGNLRERVRTLFTHKFGKLLRKIIDHLAPYDQLKATEGLKSEHEEFLTWDFNFTK